MMWFLIQRAQKLQQFVRRGFRSVKDLKIVQSAREIRGEDHILPWTIDDNTAAIGYPQSIDALLFIGAQESTRIGNNKPSVADKIHNGLAATAGLESYQTLSKEESARLLQHVLFDVGDVPEELNAELKKQIEGHILDAFRPYTDSDTDTSVFNDWFWGRHNTFIKQVARKLTNYEDKLSQEMVRHVLLKRGWEAYGYISQCVHMLMRDVDYGLAERLSLEERSSLRDALLSSGLSRWVTARHARRKAVFRQRSRTGSFSTSGRSEDRSVPASAAPFLSENGAGAEIGGPTKQRGDGRFAVVSRVR